MQSLIFVGTCLATAFALLITTAIVAMFYKFSYWRRRGIAHKRPNFFYGNLKGVMESKHFAEIFRDAYKSLKGTGPFAGFYMLFDAVVLVLDLNLIKKILIKDFNNFSERGFFYNELDDPLTAHIFSLPSEEWRQLRTKLSPAFTSGKLKSMFSNMNEIGMRMKQLVENQINAAPAATCVIEMKDLYDRFTTDVIGVTVFGLECNSLNDPETEFRKMNQNLFDNPRNHRAIDGLIYTFPNLARRLHLKQIPDKTSNFYFKIVKDTLEYRAKHNIKRNDLMNMFIELKNKGALTTNEVVANAFLFFFAGFETSSTTLALALYELAKNVECQKRLKEEIKQKLIENNGNWSYECLQNMTYTDQVINETLRKHTVIPTLQRKSLADYDVGEPKYRIFKGTTVLIPIDALHQDPDIYPEPTKFMPERFSAEHMKILHPMAWIPFGDGPRNCIGLNMARLQIRVGLVALLAFYKFSVVTETPANLEYYVQCPFLVPKSNICLGVERDDV